MNVYRDPETGGKKTQDAELPLFDKFAGERAEAASQSDRAEMPIRLKAVTSPAIQSQGEQAHARKSDPVTSHQAAASVVNIGRTREAIRSILKQFGPQTDEQIWSNYQREWIHKGATQTASPSGLRSRRAELVRMGFVVEAGTGKTAAGRACAIWKLAGRPAGETK